MSDRLCHVIHATSDPFYMYWLREMNVLAHCTIITVGDPSKEEAQQYFNENLISTLKRKLDQQPVYDARQGKQGDLILKQEKVDGFERVTEGYELDFETVYKTFGGKLAHLQGFVGDYREHLYTSLVSLEPLPDFSPVILNPRCTSELWWYPQA